MSLLVIIGELASIWQRLFLSTYFTIQFIFATIHGSHYTFRLQMGLQEE